MSGYWQILRAGSIIGLTIAFGACSQIKQVDDRGYVETNPMQEQIKVGQTTKEEVLSRLGSPSTISAFPPETWYYISRKRETIAFLAPKLVDQKIGQIEFDASGKVSKFEIYNKDAVRNISYVDRETTTEGRTLGVAEQFLGNIGRFNSKRDVAEGRN